MAATLSLFLGLCSTLPAVSLAALERVRGPLLAACGNGSREMRFTALCHVQLLLRSIPGMMGAHYKRFFCGYAEPAYIKQRKMQGEAGHQAMRQALKELKMNLSKAKVTEGAGNPQKAKSNLQKDKNIT